MLKSRAVVPLTDAVLQYWYETLKSDDISAFARSKFRFAVGDPLRLGWNSFTLGFGSAQAALDALIEQAMSGNRRAAPAGPAAATDEVGVDQDADEEDVDDEPEFTDDRIRMAVVFYASSKWKADLTLWPGMPGAKADDAPPLDIVYWFPFEIDREGRAYLPRDAQDQWPRIVRQWLDPQPVSDRDDQPEPFAHLDTYRGALETFFTACGEGASLAVYVKASVQLWTTLQQSAESDGYSRVRGFWAAVPRVPGFAVRALLDVYEAMPGDRSPGALAQLLGGSDRKSSALDVAAPIGETTARRHIGMVDKGAKVDRPDDGRSADPLNDSQRRAVHALIELDKGGGVIAVSGPPGTGKTAMLRAMIANQWVSAACEDQPVCPMTLVCGATNQSVENVMGTFDGAVGEYDALARRWLKRGGRKRLGFTASFPSTAKREKHRERFSIMKADKRSGKLVVQGVGASSTHAKREHLPFAALYWARGFEKALVALGPLLTDQQRRAVGDSVAAIARIAKSSCQSGSYPRYSDVPTTGVQEEAIKDVVLRLGTLARLLQQALHVAVGEQERVRAALIRGDGLTNGQAGAVVMLSSRWLEPLGDELKQATGAHARRLLAEKIVDVALRPLAFHLAARYWEARWLMSLAEQQEGRPANLRRLAMLFPCMVSTLHSAPRLLSDEREPMFDFVDLLIVDEAGQAAPELGAPVFSLAKKAVVVGDMKQLAPVSSITEELDARQVADRYANEALFGNWRLRGADAATGSVMKLAATGASRAERAPDGHIRDGLLLREHYRCAESIINVCIDLLYHEHDRDPDGAVRTRELVPMVKDPLPGSFADGERPLEPDPASEAALRRRMKQTYPLPPLAFFQTGGANDEPVKTDSWLNPGEVEAIVSWLETVGPRLCRWVARADGRVGEQEDLAKVIAIVSPFRGQVRAIREAVRERLDKAWTLSGEPALSERMTIGTVHTLQGAEKPVVLFSAVNKESRASQRTSNNHRERVFIDRDDGRLLNVAISRAQKCFILFGHSDLFFSAQAMSTGNDLPSAIVGRCLAGVRESEREARTGARRQPAVKLGPTKLMVVESPHKAKIIQQLLQEPIQVFGSGGHIRDLAGPGSIRSADGLKPHWYLIGRTGQTDVQMLLARTASRLLQCEELILGTDNDAQGEAIAWHILDVLSGAAWFTHVKRVRRVRFQALTSVALDDAFSEATVVEISGDTPLARTQSACAALNMGVAYGALATRVLDNLVGSVYARHGVPGGGRVKGPLLRALAGEGDEGDARGGRYGLSVGVVVGQMQQSVPARLVVSRKSGPWQPWGTSSLETAQQYRQRIAGVRLASVPCLVSGNIEHVPSDDRIGTNAVLREAFQRFRLMPSETMRLLQLLYERRPGELDDPGTDPAPGQVATGAWASVDGTGVLRLTPTGKEMAGRLLDDAWLRNISSGSLLNGFDFALSKLALKPGASLDDYRHFVATWAVRFDDTLRARDGTLEVAQPWGPTLDASGSPLDLFAQQPAVALPTWAVGDKHIALAQIATPEARAADDSLAAARHGAHGALTPLDVRVNAQSKTMQGFPDSALKVYAMLQAMTLAAVVVDTEVQLVRHVYPLDVSGAVDDEALGVEIAIATGLERAGWSAVDPVGWDCIARQWAKPEDERAIGQGAVVTVDESIHTRSLSLPSVDQLLLWMERRGLGRPSTFGTHLAALLSGPAAIGRPTGTPQATEETVEQ
ncbi:AAA domain-containing protein [Paraburkholderia sp. EG285A]|uniref:AAA domain-containing protein n=1 Tax=Paraburkholderia sp. EG285A TaxID=3237009 RepID=UPI0034D2C611